MQRGSVLDQYKLDNWGNFSSSLAKRELKWNLPVSSVLYFDNSTGVTDGSLKALDAFVYGYTS
ncbi:hypothetical protein [Paenibacillus luteus]|uniref:hypothetical protein n=1 Tax=Paenibacillus luteus TaxID=2545753 RepID=UPI0030C7A3E6